MSKKESPNPHLIDNNNNFNNNFNNNHHHRCYC